MPQRNSGIIWLDSGGAATQDLNLLDVSTQSRPDINTFVSGAAGTAFTNSAQAVRGSVRSYKSVLGNAAGDNQAILDVNWISVKAGANTGGQRFSVHVRFEAFPASGTVNFIHLFTAGINNSSWRIGINSSGRLQETQSLTTGSTLSLNTDYRISGWAYTTDNSGATSSAGMTMYLDGVVDIALSNQNVGSGDWDGIAFGLRGDPGGNAAMYMAHLYNDDKGELRSDPGDVRVTSKRPNANGSANFATTVGTGSGYGTGHSVYVNERPLNAATYVAQTTAGVVEESYTVEGKATGDHDITGKMILGCKAWMRADNSTDASPGTFIFLDHRDTVLLQQFGSGLQTHRILCGPDYPSGNSIGIATVTQSSRTTALYECGIEVAYLESGGSPPGAVLDFREQASPAFNAAIRVPHPKLGLRSVEQYDRIRMGQQ